MIKICYKVKRNKLGGLMLHDVLTKFLENRLVQKLLAETLSLSLTNTHTLAR